MFGYRLSFDKQEMKMNNGSGKPSTVSQLQQNLTSETFDQTENIQANNNFHNKYDHVLDEIKRSSPLWMFYQKCNEVSSRYIRFEQYKTKAHTIKKEPPKLVTGESVELLEPLSDD